MLDQIPDGFQWCLESDGATAATPNLQAVAMENLFATAALARRSTAPITTHDKRYLCIGVQIPGVSRASNSIGSVSLAVAAPPGFAEQVVTKVSTSLIWFSQFHARFSPRSDNFQHTLPFAEPLLGEGPFAQKLSDTAGLLSQHGKSDRVAIGILGSGKVKQLAISGQRKFTKQSPLQHRIRRGMDEVLASWDDGQVCLPTVKDHGLSLYLPLRNNEQIIGVVLFDRINGRKFSDEEVVSFAALGVGLAGLIGLARKAARDPVARSVGLVNKLWPATGLKKLLLATIMLCGLALCMFPVTHLVTADAMIEGKFQRALVAPMDTYLAEVHVVAGERVAMGDLLATFATEDLSLELLKWQSEKARKVKAKRDAAARQERTKLGVLDAEIAQADAEIALVESRIARRELRAPTNGVIVSGDLTQRLGAPVSIGEVLFEIVPEEKYQLALMIDEKDILDLKTSEQRKLQGRLKLNAYPRESIAFDITRVTPVNKVSSNGNFFIAYAEPAAHDLAVRPGMEGIAKIDVGNRPAIVNWTYNLRQWFSLTLWRWVG